MSRFFVFFAAALFLPEAFARPEYALRIRTNRCTTCHTNPAGGGHRNLTGKAFAPSPGAGAAPLQAFSQQDLFGFDWRALIYAPLPKSESAGKWSGPSVMATVPSISAPFYSSGGKEWRLVYSHNIGGYSPGARDGYLRIKLYDDYQKYPQFITFGQFAPPFGLLTDEHRTYVRIQTRTTWNHQEMGVLLSGDWTHALHYDFALVNEDQAASARRETGLAGLGGFANFRYMSAARGWMAGASASYHNNEKNSAALSLYQALSLDSLTKNKLPGTLLAEGVFGHKTNPRIKIVGAGGIFEIKNNYSDSSSLGALVRWNYNFLPKWSFVFKWDHFNPDIVKYPGDFFSRFGLGLKHFFNSQAILEARGSVVRATPEGANSALAASQNALWILLQVKI